MRQGFTLIELSIVLVIIGLIVGGILVGQDLIKAAEVRAQISQIEKYNSAVNTFKGKFSQIPGDMALSAANQFGFTTDSTCAGLAAQRDGNGLIDGHPTVHFIQTYGETGLFWQDITSPVAGSLIEGQFPNSGAIATNCSAAIALNTSPGTTYLGDYFPVAKIGHGNFIYVYENSGYNWYGVAAITSTTGGGGISISATIPVMQSYNIDKKVDDGLPTTGAVLAAYAQYNVMATGSIATTDNPTTCYNTTSNFYSISSPANYGAGGNCGLSFRFQ